MKYFTYIFILWIALTSTDIDGQNLLRTSNASIDFVSDAPLEIIKAKSDNCQGILNLDNGEFAFRVFIKTFDGFNNPLQREHFYENYMEVSDFPEATFSGKIIENIDTLTQTPNIYRAKGVLNIHGQSIERIIQVTLSMNENQISFNCSFIVPLEDHNIEIPNIVRQKIAENITVSVSGILQ